MSLDYLYHLRRDSSRFLQLLRDADPSARVPSCPDWDAADLLWHLAEVQWFWGTIVGDRLQDTEAYAEPERPEEYADLVAFFERSTDRLQSTLTETDPTVEVWMWGADKTVGYVRRRQAHEALVHRRDAELTVGAVTPFDPELASDGVHEVFTVMYGGVPAWGTFTSEQRFVVVEATDAGLVLPLELGRWAGTSPNTGTSYDEPACELVTTGPFTPTATVRGTAADLDAWAWGRGDASSLEVAGDRAAFDRLQVIIDQGID